ncbi:TVP38/TMEM64 family protein [Methylobacterium nigriterrae]|uniref:TVP38/TMEM64 family protein n=1 Tax=Methylobacterium nigriterrae TaxID=3127512 RepID=UPI003013C902
MREGALVHSGGESDELRYWLIIAGAAAATLAAWHLLPVDAWLRVFGRWSAGFGMLGLLVFGAIFLVATLLVVPCTPLTIAGAVAFGWWAMPIVLISATGGSLLAFLAARTLFRERIRSAIARRPALKATADAVGDGEWRLLVLMRLSPFVPFNAQNYALDVTNVGLAAFLVSTVTGMLPGTGLCIYLGLIGRAAGQEGPIHWISLGLGLVTTAVLVVLTRRRVRDKLKARHREPGIHPRP